MTWRTFTNHKQESRQVKKLLAKDYPDVRVKHGRGTAWGWLEVSFSIPRPIDCYCDGYNQGADWTKIREQEHGFRCRHCSREWDRVYRKVGQEVQKFTGRNGDYGGCINFNISFQ